MGGVLRDVHYLEYTRFDVPSTHSYNVDERGLSRVLQTYERQLHLFLPEEALDPFDYSTDETQHF